jgi:4'-phosphopantetheinyl transferase EntD
VRKIQEFDAVKLIQADAHVLRFELTRDWSMQWKAGACVEVNYTIVRDYIVTATYVGSEYAVDSRFPPEAGH